MSPIQRPKSPARPLVQRAFAPSVIATSSSGSVIPFPLSRTVTLLAVLSSRKALTSDAPAEMLLSITSDKADAVRVTKATKCFQHYLPWAVHSESCPSFGEPCQSVVRSQGSSSSFAPSSSSKKCAATSHPATLRASNPAVVPPHMPHVCGDSFLAIRMRNLRRALTSIWRIRSRVTPNLCPTSSRVMVLVT